MKRPGKKARKGKGDTTKIGIAPKEFHKILDKASQPIKKSEKEKS